nr:hypothetical protein [Phenylobacterium sp.]
MDIREVAFHFDMTDLRREAEAAATHFGPSEEDQERAMAHLGSPEVVQRREEFFARRRLMIRPSGEGAEA